MARIQYVETLHAYPSRNGLTAATDRTCAACASDDSARERGPSADQDSPCACCGRRPEQAAEQPNCRHTDWAAEAEYLSRKARQ